MKISWGTIVLSAIAGADALVKFDLRSKNLPQNRLADYISNPFGELVEALTGEDDSDDTVSKGSLRQYNVAENNLTLTPSYNFYITNISVGTPEQQVEVGFDTGSPYLWVFGPNGSFGDAPQFYPDKSSTFEYQGNRNFSVLYGAGLIAGKWGQDDIHIGEDSLEDFPFGVIDEFSISAGVPGLIGIGPGPNLTDETYSNVPEAFYESGVTKSPIFSVYLDAASQEGGVIFGGYDPTKYVEPVYEYDIVSVSQMQPTYYYQLRVDAVKLDGSNYTVSNVAVLDTGSPFCQLPPNFVQEVGQKLGFKSYAKYQAWYQPSGVTLDETVTVSFVLGHLTVDIPVKDLMVPGKYLWVNDGPPEADEDVMALGLMGAPSYVLGDVFFKHVYAAFDSKNGKIYLAKSSEDFTQDDVQEFTSSTFPGAVQGAVPLAGPTHLTTRPAAAPSATTAPSVSGEQANARRFLEDLGFDLDRN
ncbi:hypothetical protein TRVA0_029S00672 [Trichomonascus vanleenenianus]|uniref:pepsin-like aspartic protease n=1 Tax=Trichomonascus vanleenenianus TaxID=2268995 RepID=UPI003ECAA590